MSDYKIYAPNATPEQMEILQAIHKLLPYGCLRRGEPVQVARNFHLLCENFNVEQAYKVCHPLFRRKRG